MLKLSLTGDDLLRLIEACGKAGVSNLKLGKDIELTFGGKADPAKVPVEVKANTPLEEAIEKESFVKAEADIRKDRLESMILEDPSNFERLLASGDLVDDETTEN